MRPFVKGIVGAGLVAALILGLRWLVPSDEQRMVRLIEDVAKRASFGGNEGNLARLAGAEALASRFTADAEIHVDAVVPAVGPLIGRSAIQQVALAVRQGGGVRVTILGAMAEVEGPGVGRVRFAASADTGGGDGTFEAQEFEARVRRVDGRWLVERVDVVPLLRPAPAE